jgi:flagellar biosynthesis/type III secretory pathway protein FliH
VAPVEIPERQIELSPPPAPPPPMVVSEPCPVCPSQTQTIAELQQELAGVRADNQALARLVAQMSTLEPGAIKGLHEELQRAAVLIAESIMGRAVEVDSSWLSQQITQCLSQVEHALGAVRVMVNPADFAALESSWEALHSEARLVADPRLQRGGFLIESPEFAVDAGLGRRLQWAGSEEKAL